MLGIRIGRRGRSVPPHVGMAPRSAVSAVIELCSIQSFIFRPKTAQYILPVKTLLESHCRRARVRVALRGTLAAGVHGLQLGLFDALDHSYFLESDEQRLNDRVNYCVL